MTTGHMSKKAEKYLQRLCLEIPSRRVGSIGNRVATDYFADSIAAFGFQIERPLFNCIDWIENGAQLTVEGDSFDIWVSPYSLGGHFRAPLIEVSTVEALKVAKLTNQILLMHGEIVIPEERWDEPVVQNTDRITLFTAIEGG